MSDIKIAPSLLAADKTDLRTPIGILKDQADVFHVDVMDGHFVPNISFGPSVVQHLRPLTARPLDVHLMVSEPDQWVPVYRQAGADWLSVHAEATVHLERTVSHVREVGARAGIGLNPATPFAGLEYVLRNGDFVLVMTVNPGYGGQRFIESSIGKIRALREMLDGNGLHEVDIQVDGGIDATTAGRVADAGARILVAGSAILGAPDPVTAASEIRAVAQAATSVVSEL